jgi:hypothetical protein
MKNTNQQTSVETNNGKTGQEYVLVYGQDLFLVDYDEGIATLREDITLDDLEVNNDEYTDLAEHSLYTYLEYHGFVVDEEHSTEGKYFFSGVVQ